MRQNDEYFVKYNNHLKVFSSIRELNNGIQDFTNKSFNIALERINDQTLCYYLLPNENNNIYKLTLNDTTGLHNDVIFAGDTNRFITTVSNFKSCRFFHCTFNKGNKLEL